MKPIKCKAWDEINKEWVTDGFCLRFDANGSCEILNVFGQAFTDGRKLVATLSTGLSDKCGADIYHGDIISVWCGKCGEHEPAFVDFNNGGFVFTGVDCEKHGGWLRTKEARACEIIGNVFEHPDLLKGAK